MFFPGVYGGGLSNGAIIGRRNLIINGAMAVAQKGTNVTGITSSGYYTVDRFYIDRSGTFTLTDEQSTDAPEGFSFSKKITHTGANVALSASDYFISFDTRLEGQDLQHLKYGTANAETVTVSFWFKTNKIGTYVCEIDSYSELATRYVISQSFSVTDVNWNKYEFTFPGNTLDNIRNNNQKGFGFVIWVAAGSNFTSGGTLNSSWNLETSIRDQRAFGVSDTLNTNEFWACTGVQVELGNKATPFEYRPYGLELNLCQRYFQKLTIPQNSYIGQFSNYANPNGTFYGQSLTLPVEMRANPSGLYEYVSLAQYWTQIGIATYSANTDSGIFFNTTRSSFCMGQARTIGANNPVSGSYYTFEASFNVYLSAII